MTLRARFTLIAFGVLIFFILGPLIIFAARGFWYDFEENRIIKTGTLTIKTEPKDAAVHLNGKEIGSTPFAKRFMSPGEYEIEVTKTGYLPWKKRIAIREQQVAALPTQAPSLTLFLENPDRFLVSTSTADFFLNKNEIYYLAQSQVYRFALTGEKTTLATTTVQLTLDAEKFVPPPQAIPTTTREDLLASASSDVEYFDQTGHSNVLIYGNKHEVWLYNTDTQKNTLITRSSQNLGQAIYSAATGYAFFAEGNIIKAIEIDPLGQPNAYTFVETKTALPKFAISPDGTYLIYLDGQELISIRIQ